MFWNIINKINNQKFRNNNSDELLPQEDFLHFYKKLNTEDINNNNFQSQIIQDFNDIKNNNSNKNSSSNLNSEITCDEILSAIKSVKNGKSTSADMISNEMLKNATSTLLKPLHKLFNMIFNSGQFPVAWNESFLVLLHKKGEKLDPGNYRGISISSNLGKLFNKVMYFRLVKFMDDENLIAKTNRF